MAPWVEMPCAEEAGWTVRNLEVPPPDSKPAFQPDNRRGKSLRRESPRYASGRPRCPGPHLTPFDPKTKLTVVPQDQNTRPPSWHSDNVPSSAPRQTGKASGVTVEALVTELCTVRAASHSQRWRNLLTTRHDDCGVPVREIATWGFRSQETFSPRIHHASPTPLLPDRVDSPVETRGTTNHSSSLHPN